MAVIIAAAAAITNFLCKASFSSITRPFFTRGNESYGHQNYTSKMNIPNILPRKNHLLILLNIVAPLKQLNENQKPEKPV
jgi:hypothetical protein